MKTITLTLLAATMLFAKDPQSKPAQPKKPAAAAQKASLPAIPAGATQVGPNLYRYTDANGKAWMYTRTPFGISKWEDSQTPVQPAADNSGVTVTDLGDNVRFERKTPFGTTQWVHSKSELTDEEKKLVADDAARRQPQASDANANSAPSADKQDTNKATERQ